MPRHDERIPPAALAGMEDWEARVVWVFRPEVTTWRLVSPDGEVRFLKLARLEEQVGLAAERDRLLWTAARLPVPRMLGYGTDGEQAWLLTEGLEGVDATDDGLRSDPNRLIPLLASGLRRIHSLPIKDCPFDSCNDVMLQAAQRRVVAGLVDSVREPIDPGGSLTAAKALERLERLRPRYEDLVVCHGDYCLPNVLIRDGRVSGYVDLGALGVADRWWDLAVASWSVTWNLGPGWEDHFLAAYGIARDPDKLAFYRLLYDLLP